MNVLRTPSLGSNFTGSYKKKECSALCQNKFLLILLIKCSGISLSYSITHQLTEFIDHGAARDKVFTK